MFTQDTGTTFQSDLSPAFITGCIDITGNWTVSLDDESLTNVAKWAVFVDALGNITTAFDPDADYQNLGYNYENQSYVNVTVSQDVLDITKTVMLYKQFFYICLQTLHYRQT